MEILDARIREQVAQVIQQLLGGLGRRDKVVQDRQGFKNGIYRMTCRLSGWIGNESGTHPTVSHHSGNQAAVERLLEESVFH